MSVTAITPSNQLTITTCELQTKMLSIRNAAYKQNIYTVTTN